MLMWVFALSVVNEGVATADISKCRCVSQAGQLATKCQWFLAADYSCECLSARLFHLTPSILSGLLSMKTFLNKEADKLNRKPLITKWLYAGSHPLL